ncbi:MAG: phage holin family protein [Chthoniobacterales bacterium]
MNPQDLPGGIPSRITGLIAGILRYAFSIGALAAEEGRLLIRQSIAAILLLMVMAVIAMIAYVALVAAAVSLLAMKLQWGWPVSLSAAGLIHLALLGILFNILRTRTAPRPFEATSAELRRDIETLGNYAKRTP